MWNKNPEKYVNYFIFLNASIKQKLELYNHKQTLLIEIKFLDNDPEYVPLVVNTYYRVVTRLTRRVSLVKQELFTLPKHLSSPPVFTWVRTTGILR
jgi:hypothetical protein